MKITGKPSRKIDKKNGPGLNGSRLTDQGYDSPTLTMTVTIATADEWDAWQAFETAIGPAPGKAPKLPLDFSYAGAPRIKAVVVQSISIVDIDDKDLGKITCELIHWLNPGKSAVTTPKSKGVDLQGIDGKPTGAAQPPVGPPAPPSANPATSGPGG